MSHHHVLGGLAIAFLLVASLEEWSVGHAIKEAADKVTGTHAVQQAPTQTSPAPTTPQTR